MNVRMEFRALCKKKARKTKVDKLFQRSRKYKKGKLLSENA